MEFCVTYNTINKFLYYVKKEKVEVCCNLIKNIRGEYEIAISIKGTTVNGRNTCNYKHYSDCLFHSHPMDARSYPSREDIFKVMKRDTIKLSIIGTRWGIYTIKPTKSSYNKWNSTDYNQLDKHIKHIIDKIGIMENNKGYKNGNRSMNLTVSERQVINDSLTSLEDYTELILKFYPWEYFVTEGIIITK